MNRKKGTSFVVPIVYGSLAIPVKPSDFMPDPTHTHKWSVFVKSNKGISLAPILSSVEFKLHESFIDSNRIILEEPFEVNESGWGEFEIIIKLNFIDPTEKSILLYHHLQLYPKPPPPIVDGDVVEQPPLIKSEVLLQKYDEILFQDPTIEMHQALSSLSTLKKSNLYFTPEMEQEELNRLKYALEEVKTEFEKYKLIFDKKKI
ncbi:YEATS domain-containing protein 4 [Lobulomyces angularis]|nr:YEATS domain-containing protein 4 [Lobulomyces angularis]